MEDKSFVPANAASHNPFIPSSCASVAGPNAPMNTASLLRLFTLAALWGGSFLFVRMTVPVLGAVPAAFGRVPWRRQG